MEPFAATGVLRTGDHVRVRRERWQIVAVADHDGCRAITLDGLGPDNACHRRTLLEPFEVIEPIDTEAGRWLTGRRRWWRACRSVLASLGGWTALHTAERAHIDVMPHQIEPTLAVLNGHATRVLLADAVGLGKTVQAGLLIAELMARGAVDSALVITPVGLRDQWAGELATRFRLEPVVVDLATAASAAAALPAGVNPWSTRVLAIASLDYVKRPEVLPAARARAWDAVVVDEAHLLGSGSDRLAAIETLCGSAPFVILVTATPHSGDSQAFDALCAVGGRRDPLLIFRRSRQDVRLAAVGVRRMHRLIVTATAAELRMHRALARYSAIITRECGDGHDAALLLTTLQKRALSSPESLRLSVARRLTALAEAPGPVTWQPWLPLDDGGGELDASDDAPVLDRPAMADVARERLLLQPVLVAAQAALPGESKLAALRRLLRRLGRRHEASIVFTEYRDTLQHIHRELARPAVLLHGGMSRSDRQAAVDAFTSGRSTLLLATDAGGEGLNLHSRCRCVIHVELPWNPTRLEQRTGRVDRIGQRRAVHVFHLVGQSEVGMLTRLEARVARARRDVGSGKPASDVRALGEAEARRIVHARGLTVHESPAPSRRPTRVVAIARGGLRHGLGGRALLLTELVASDVAGRRVASHIALFQLSLGERGPITPAGAGRVAARSPIIKAALGEATRSFLSEVGAGARETFWTRALARARRIANTMAADAPPLVQPGLFQRRGDRASRSLVHERAALRAATAHRVERYTRASSPCRVGVATELLLLP